MLVSCVLVLIKVSFRVVGVIICVLVSFRLRVRIGVMEEILGGELSLEIVFFYMFRIKFVYGFVVFVGDG